MYNELLSFFTELPDDRIVLEGAQSIHGIANKQAASFEDLGSQWHRMADYFKNQLVTIHNASFDWPILVGYVMQSRHRGR